MVRIPFFSVWISYTFLTVFMVMAKCDQDVLALTHLFLRGACPIRASTNSVHRAGAWMNAD